MPQGGGHLALAAPAKSSTEFEARAAAGEFDQAPVTFKNADGQPAALRPDIEALRQQVAELRAKGPKHPFPVGPHGQRLPPTSANLGGTVGARPDDKLPVIEPPLPYWRKPVPPIVPGPMPPQRPRLTNEEALVGTGAEGVEEGIDPSEIGGARGFKMA